MNAQSAVATATPAEAAGSGQPKGGPVGTEAKSAQPAATGTGAVHRLGLLSEIPVGEARAYAVGDAQIAVFRLRGDVLRAVDAVCPHAGGPLADGQADAGVVICPLHSHVFNLATGESSSGAAPIGCYPVRLAVDGTIELTL
jgi:nitrite reductase (NADH) small subunit